MSTQRRVHSRPVPGARIVRPIPTALLALLAACSDPSSRVHPSTASTAHWNGAAARLLAATIAKCDDGAAPHNVGLFVPALLPLLEGLAEGSGGATRTQFESALGPFDHTGNQARLGELRRLDDVDFACATKYWLDERLVVEPAWRELVTAKRQYHAELETLDLERADKAKLAKQVNSFLSDVVDHDVAALAPSDLHDPLQLVLASGARVAWKWATPFEEDETTPCDFFPTPDRKRGVRVPTMHLSETLSTFELDGCTAARLACKGGLALDLVKLGGDHARRDALLAKPHWLDELDAARVAAKAVHQNLALPKLATQTSVELRPALESLGVADVFTAKADLSGVAKSSTPLFLDVLRHGVGVEWDEQGGHSFSFSSGAVCTADVSRPLAFDEPFLALLRDPDGAVILGEWVANPQAR